MTRSRSQNAQLFLIIGDLVTMALVTIFGFTAHQELSSASLQRILAVFLPMVVAWLAMLPFSRVYDLKIASTTSHLWRPFWAMVVCMPIAMWLRSAWLNTDMVPLFVMVMAVSSGLAILAWRAIFIWLGGDKV